MEHSLWDAGCRGKMRYKSRRAALAAMRVMVQSGRVHRVSSLHEYRCPACKYWHLGNRRREFLSPLKQIRAASEDTVEIIWQGPDGKETRTRHRAPMED